MPQTLPLTDRPSWKALRAHHGKIRNLHLRTLFAEDATRGERLTAEAVGLYLDYSKNRVTDETLTAAGSEHFGDFLAAENVDGVGMADRDSVQRLRRVASSIKRVNSQVGSGLRTRGSGWPQYATFGPRPRLAHVLSLEP